MSLIKVRCVLVPIGNEKRLRLMDIKELDRLVEEGKAVQKGRALWEVLAEGEVAPAKPAPKKVAAEQTSTAPASKPQNQTNSQHKPHPHTAGKKQHGSKAK